MHHKMSYPMRDENRESKQNIPTAEVGAIAITIIRLEEPDRDDSEFQYV